MAEEVKKEQASPRSFRVTDEVMEKIRTVQTELGLTQDAALRQLIDAYEFQQAKEQIPSRETEISNFEAKAQELVAAFLHSLQLNMDAETRIRAEFAQKIQLQDQSILDYQEQIKALKAKNAEMAESAALAVTLQEQLFVVQDTARKTKAELEDRINEQKLTICGLQSDNAALRVQADGHPALVAERDTLAGKLRDTQQRLTDLEKDHKMELERAEMAAQKKQDDAVTAIKAEMQTRVAEAQIAGERAVAEAQQAAAVELRAAIHEAEEKTHALDKELLKTQMENKMLRDQLAKLQAASK